MEVGMTLYRSEVHKIANGKKFANDYIIEAADMVSASNIAQAWVAFERALMTTPVQFLDVRTSTVAKGDRIFHHVPLNLPGLSGYGADQMLPPYCTLRVDFATSDSDPGHKYYRYAIAESVQGSGALSQSFIDTTLAALNTMIAGAPTMLTALRIGKHQRPPLAVSIYPLVQERQERRRRKKKVATIG